MYSFVLVVKGKSPLVVAAEDDAVLTTENLESVRVGSCAAKPNGDCRGVPSSSILISFGVCTKTGNKQRCSRISSCVMVVGLNWVENVGVGAKVGDNGDEILGKDC